MAAAILAPLGFMTKVILRLLGFGSSGPVAGSLAAWFQSAWGVNFIFSALQSTAMGGASSAWVNVTLIPALAIIFRGMAAIIGIAQELVGWVGRL